MSLAKSSLSNPDTRFIVERFASTLEELHEVLDDYYDKIPRHVFNLIENMLDDYKDIYGKDAKRDINRRGN